MKKSIFFLFLISLLMIPSAEAQFFKKLKEKVQDKVEDAVVDNVSDKAANEANEKLNRLWETKLENTSIPMGTEMVPQEDIPDIYKFDWEYSLSMETTEGNMEMTYLLNEEAPYTGIRIPQAPNMFTVLDTETNLTVMFLSSEGNNMVTATRMPEDSSTDGEPENPYDDMEITEIDGKTILGYECRGYRMENEDTVFDFYVTDETGLSFSDMFHTNQEEMPKSFDPDFLQETDGLMMQMEMKDKKDPAKTVTMTCTGIEEKDFAISKSDYISLAGN